MQSFDQILKNEQTTKLISDPERLEQLRNTPELQKIFSLLSENTEGNLEQAANRAAQGETTQLISAIRKLLHDPTGAKLVQQMKEKLK